MEGSSGGKALRDEVPFSEKQIVTIAEVIQELIDKALAKQGAPQIQFGKYFPMICGKVCYAIFSPLHKGSNHGKVN